MPDVVAPYVIGTILTVENTGGANTDPRYAGGATRVRNRLLVKISYASGIFPRYIPRKVLNSELSKHFDDGRCV